MKELHRVYVTMNYYVLMGNRMLQKKKTVNSCGSHTIIILHVLIIVYYKKLDCQFTSVYLAQKYYSCTYNNIEYTKSCLPPEWEHHFTCSSEQHEGLVTCKAKPVPLYLRPGYIGSALGIQPTTSSTLKSSTLPTELVLLGSALTQYNTISTLLTWL